MYFSVCTLYNKKLKIDNKNKVGGGRGDRVDKEWPNSRLGIPEQVVWILGKDFKTKAILHSLNILFEFIFLQWLLIM